MSKSIVYMHYKGSVITMKQFLLLYLAKHYGLSRENCDEKSRYLLLKR